MTDKKTLPEQSDQTDQTETYTAWDKVPSHLKTKTQLNKLGKKPVKGQPHEAKFCSHFYGKRHPRYYHLYDINKAAAKSPTKAQLANLEKARAVAKEKSICQQCKTTYPKPLKTYPHCERCLDHLDMIAWATKTLADPNAIILDTETTGLNKTDNDQPLEISIINTAGEILLNTLVQVTVPISSGAIGLHGITQDMLNNAPTFPQIYPKLCLLLATASQTIIYNANFDVLILENARRAYNLPFYPNADIIEGLTYLDENHEEQKEPDYCIMWKQTTCAMQNYAKWYGEWSNYHENYKYQKLSGGNHRALGDCQATLALIKTMTQNKYLTNDDLIDTINKTCYPDYKQKVSTNG